MDWKKIRIRCEDRECVIYEPEDAVPEVFLIQPVDEHDLEELDQEVSGIARLADSAGEAAGGKPFLLAAVHVKNWNRELSPWPAPPVFGREPFGDGAGEMLDFIEKKLVPYLENRYPDRRTDLKSTAGRPCFIGGYSLAGFFALWSVYQTGFFAGAAAVSPSVWFPGWTDYAAAHPCRTGLVYLSLGIKEEKTRNKVMAQVGDAIRAQLELLKEGETRAVLEWNEGNHFMDPGNRTAKGFAWLLSH